MRPRLLKNCPILRPKYRPKHDREKGLTCHIREFSLSPTCRFGSVTCYRELTLSGSGGAVDDYDIKRSFAAFATQAELFAQGGLPINLQSLGAMRRRRP
jgi:hypothetical protein